MSIIQFVDAGRAFVRGSGDIVHAVKNYDGVIEEGQFVCMIGPSGCGKTTLLQMVAGLVPATQGQVLYAGSPVNGPGPERGLVFQKDSVFPWMRVVDNVQYGLRNRGVPRSERLRIAREYLARVGLSHVEQAWPRELSGGMLKRVAIATVFANGGRVLLLDEPFGALDYVTRYQLQEVLLELWGQQQGQEKRTVLFVTHDIDEAILLADRIIVLRAGVQVDDLIVSAARPRRLDSLLSPESIRVKQTLIKHLGF
jgi:NitT/TauT family transport system ATP-binding protein